MKNILTIILAAATIFAAGCCIPGRCITGSGDLTTETRDVDGFTSINIDAPGDLVITKGETFKVSIRTDDNFIDDITTEVKNDTLYIDREPHYRCIDPTLMEVTIRVPELRNVEIDGSSDVVIEDSFEGEQMTFSIDGSADIVAEAPLVAGVFNLNIDGSGDVDLELDVVELNTIVDGSGDMTYSGFAAEHYILVDGSGDMKAYNLATDMTEIRIDGSGSCKVSVVEELTVDINGSGDVYYKGNPDVSRNISGSGSVRDAN